MPQYPSPREGATRCAAVRSPLSACVRAVAKQQPGKVFPGGPTPEVCHSPVASGLWKHLSVGRGAITDTISPLSPRPSRLLVTGCGKHKLFSSLLQQPVSDGKCLWTPSLATKFVCFVATAAKEWMGKK